MVGSFNVRGARFSEKERTWVRLEDGEIPAVKGTVAPCDVHAFIAEKPHTQSTQSEMAPARGSEGDHEEEYAVYLHCRQEARVLGLTEAIDIEVCPLSYELATFSRVVELGQCPQRSEQRTGEPGEPLRWASLGLAKMFNSSAAVTEQATSISGVEGVSRIELAASNQRGGAAGVPVVVLSVKGSGRFLALSSRPPTRAALGSGSVGADDVVGMSEGLEEKDWEPDVAVVDTSFSYLPESCASRGGRGMGLVEVVIPGPWDGQERRLLFWWD